MDRHSKIMKENSCRSKDFLKEKNLCNFCMFLSFLGAEVGEHRFLLLASHLGLRIKDTEMERTPRNEDS